MSETTDSGLSLSVIIALVLFALIGGGGYAYLSATDRLDPVLSCIKDPQSCLKDSKDQDLQEEEVAEEEAAAESVNSLRAGIVPLSALASTESMLKDRVLGFPSAPIKISEHSSLTCSHCGKFHRESFEQLKNEYLATGKASLVFSDFPLNAPALYASMVTRCVAEENYFDMVQDLFETQDEWAYNVKYLDYLKETANSYGLPEELFKECVKNEELRQGLLSQMQDAQRASEITSTPTFVINDSGHINGALPFAEFKSAIEAAIAPASVLVLEEVDAPSSGE